MGEVTASERNLRAVVREVEWQEKLGYDPRLRGTGLSN